MTDLAYEASEAIRAVFNDASIDRATTLDSLELLAEELDTMIEALKTDIA